MALQPFRVSLAGALFGQVGAEASAHTVQFVTAATAVCLEQATAFGQFRHAGNVALFVATPTGGADVVFREQRLAPEGDLPMRTLSVSREPLPSVADCAAELGGAMRQQVRMKGERQRRTFHGGIFHPEVASGATVHALKRGKQNLLYSQRCGQDGVLSGGVGLPHRFQTVVPRLILLPRRSCGLPNGRKHDHQDDEAQREEQLRHPPVHYSAPDMCTQGGTQAQPGPRK